MTNHIQQARAVLAKWRTDATAAPWSLDDHAPWDHMAINVAGDGGEADVTDYIAGWDARLIVGTAGNPALLDAIDGLLDVLPQSERVTLWAERIVAAILAADERMGQ